MTQPVDSSIFSLSRGQEFDLNFAEYHEDKAFIVLRKGLREHKYKVGDTGVSYRVISHWEDNNLMPAGIKSDGGWRKFSVVEIVWIKLINRLREFGMSLEKISKVKEHVMMWDKKRDTYPLFEYYVARAYASSSDPYVVITKDGSADIGSSDEIEMTKIVYGSLDMLCISLKSILSEMSLSPTKPQERIYKLTRHEEKLLESIRMEENKEITLRLNSNDIKEITTVKNYPESPSENEIKKKIKDSKAYAETVTRYAGGKAQSAELRIKRRLD